MLLILILLVIIPNCTSFFFLCSLYWISLSAGTMLSLNVQFHQVVGCFIQTSTTASSWPFTGAPTGNSKSVVRELCCIILCWEHPGITWVVPLPGLPIQSSQCPAWLSPLLLLLLGSVLLGGYFCSFGTTSWKCWRLFRAVLFLTVAVSFTFPLLFDPWNHFWNLTLMTYCFSLFSLNPSL